MKTKDERKASGSEEMKLLILRRTSDRIKPWLVYLMMTMFYTLDVVYVRGGRGALILLDVPGRGK